MQEAESPEYQQNIERIKNSLPAPLWHAIERLREPQKSLLLKSAVHNLTCQDIDQLQNPILKNWQRLQNNVYDPVEYFDSIRQGTIKKYLRSTTIWHPVQLYNLTGHHLRRYPPQYRLRSVKASDTKTVPHP